MTTLAFSTDYVQLPADGAGKRSSYYRFDTGGGDYLYLGAGVIVGATGIIADVDASGLKVNLGADNDVIAAGDIAHDAPDSGNPVKIGGKATNTNPSSVSVSDRVDAWFSIKGAQMAGILSQGLTSFSDAVANSSLPNLITPSGQQEYYVGSFGFVYNGSTWDRARGNTNGQYVHGNVASGATDAGNPVKVGGRYNTTPPTLTDGQRGDLQLTAAGELKVSLAAALAAGNNNIGDVDVASVPAPLSTTGGGTEATALRVTVATDSTGVLSVDDNGGSLSIDDGGNVITVDGTVAVTNSDLGTIAGAVSGVEMQVDVVGALPAGNNNIGDVDVASLPALVAGNANIGDVDIASVASGALIEVIGDVAGDAAVPTNPVIIGARASTAQPTDVSADGDAVHLWATRKGSLMVAPVPHAGLDGAPFALTSKTVQVTTAQTGTDIWTPTSGKKLCIISYQIQAFSTTPGTCIIWFGANADTTYTRGTDLAIFDGEFAPSATLKPGVVQSGIWIASAVDHEVHLTSVGDIDLTITLWGYEI